MKRGIHIMTILSFIGLYITSCKKEKVPVPIKFELRFSRNALSYVNIPVGRYFIYKDSASLQLDSVVVMNTKLQVFDKPGVFSGNWLEDWLGIGTPAIFSSEKFDIQLSSWKNGLISDWLTASCQLNTYYLSAPVNDTSAVSLRIQKNMVFYQTHTGTKTYNITLEGKVYTDVNITNDNNGLEKTNPFYYESTYYWAKGIGVIKRTIKDGVKPEQTVYLVRNN